MRKIVLLIMVNMLVLWGCSKDTSPLDSRANDELQIQEEIAAIETSAEEDFFYSDLDEESEDNFFKPVEFDLAKPIIPLRFGRIRMHPVEKNIHIVFNTDTTATVYYDKIIRGKFISMVADTSEADTVKLYRSSRPMNHEFQRVAHFAKRNDKWRMVSFSMAEGNSLGDVESGPATVNATVRIVKLVIATPDTTFEITNPLAYFQKRKNPFTFYHGTDVKVTVHIENSTMNPVYFPLGTEQTEFVRLHYARHRYMRHHQIKRFKYLGKDDLGNNVYEGLWYIGQWRGVHHAVIDVIDNGTIYDDDVNTYPYNSTTWSTPYRASFQ
ncbi:MAG: hypothetical protein E4H13_00665 [Calditrichales bacterium]|nr:MAG: hypothetical protein E4H13_00665 [Calditrichales bacterium]